MSDQSGGEGWWLASDGKWYPPTQQSGYAPPPLPPSYAAPPSGYQVFTPAAPRTNGYAIAAMVLGIVWIYGIGSILALIFGYKSRSEIDQSNGTQTGRGMSTAGIVLGWVGIAGVILLILFAVVLVNEASDGFNTDPIDGYCNEARYWQDPDC